MTIPMHGTAPPQSLRLRWPVWGFDISTKRISAGILIPIRATELTQRANGVIVEPGGHLEPAVFATTLTLKTHENPGLFHREAVVQTTAWLGKLERQFGRPGAIGLEVPIAGARTPLVSFWMIGVFYAAAGGIWRDMLYLELNPGEWKKPATGSGYAPGLPMAAKRADKRKAEKARIQAWARDVCLWGGTVEDEADALGVATATGIKLAAKWSVPARNV